MKFIFSDSMDFVDPDFNFGDDCSDEGRISQRDDLYPHEILTHAPYDGILVSRGIVGSANARGKYSSPQMMRFRREGARRFLRYSESKYPGSLVFGDCGAFTYRSAQVPPYTPADTAEFYADGQFTHGCSVDHLIFDFDDPPGRPSKSVPRAILDRYDLTLQNAKEFLRESKQIGKGFTPIGVIQGWSTESMAAATKTLVRMGYTYLAIGGMVPLSVAQIHRAVDAIRRAAPPRVRLHLLGFGKIEQIDEFLDYGIASFDTSSPILRAFKDARKNYFAQGPDGQMRYYMAIRIPHATESNALKAAARGKGANQEALRLLETKALAALRSYAAHKCSVDTALDAILTYWRAIEWKSIHTASARAEKALELEYRRTLTERPWEHCGCVICRTSGVETVLFRSSNRNKRRGIHNLAVVSDHLNGMKKAA